MRVGSAGPVVLMVLVGCITSVITPGRTQPVDQTLEYTGEARGWHCTGFTAERIVDASARPLVARMRVGEKLSWTIDCHPNERHHDGIPRFRWISSRPDVVAVKVPWELFYGSFPTSPELHALREGESEIHAMVDSYGGLRAGLSYFCCRQRREDCPTELPYCELVPIGAVVVTR
jgi:hypothetical protein